MKQVIFFLIFSSSSILAQSGKNTVSITYEKDTSVWQYHCIICTIKNNTDSTLTYSARAISRDNNVETITPKITYKFLKANGWVDDDYFYCGTMIRKRSLLPGESLRFLITTNYFRDSVKAIRMGINLSPQQPSSYKDYKTIWSDEIMIR
jgi:hypothetical protein